MTQFRDKQPSFDNTSFHTGDTAKNPVIYPPQWMAPQKAQPTILHLVGFVAVSGLTLYGAIEIIYLLVKVFPWR